MGSKAEWSGVEQNGVMEWSEFCNKPENFFKLHLAYLHNFLWTRALKHNQFVEIKQFFKVDIKQNSVSTVIWLIKFVVYQWSRSAPSGGSRVVYIFVYLTKSVFSQTSNHIFVHFNQYDASYSYNKWCAQRFIKFTDEKLKPKVQIEVEIGNVGSRSKQLILIRLRFYMMISLVWQDSQEITPLFHNASFLPKHLHV